MTTRRLFLSVVMALLCLSVIAQNKENEIDDNGDVEFEDGTIINYKLLENSADIRSNWSLQGVFSPIYFEKYIVLGLGLEGRANLFDVAEFRGLTRGGLHIDVSLPDDEAVKSFKRQYQHHMLETSIKFYKTKEEKESAIILDQKYTGNGTMTTYYYMGKLNYQLRYGLIAGIESMQRRVSNDLEFEATVPDTNVNGVQMSAIQPLTIFQTNARLGLDINWIMSSLIEVNGYQRVEYQHLRLYSVVLLPLEQRLEVVRYGTDFFDNPPTIYVEDGYISPGFESLGYMLGGEVMNNKGFWGGYFAASLELGLLPGIKYERLIDSFTASIGIKVGFGTNLLEKMQKSSKSK